MNDPLLETLVDGRYQVRSRIARGGMSTVYLATDTRLDRDVALKVLYPHLAADRGFLDRFEREAKSAARLSHPHVVGVLDQGIEGSLAYLVMEYVPGRTLRDVLNERTVLTPRLALAMMDAVVDGLAAAHEAGLVHRDVKPENVLLAGSGAIKIADFGLARAVTTSTNTGTLVGTVAYLAPELVTGAGADARSDIYSAGIMLYEMLTGVQPFTGEVPIQVAFAHVHSTVPAPSALCPGLAQDLDELVQWCTAQDPEERPVDGSALLGELRHIRTSLTDEQLDFHAPGTTAPQLPGQTDATTVVRPPSGATEVLRRTEAVGRTEPNATEILQRADNATTVLSTAGHQEQDQDAGYDDEGDEDYVSPRAGRRQARRDFKARQKQSSRDAQRPEVSLRSGRPRRRGVLLALLLTLLVAAAAFAGWFFGAGPGALVAVPDVSNTSVEAAGARLGEEGLRYTTDEVYDEVVAAGLAIGTEPGAAEEIRRFQPVTLLVSRGPELFAVPNVIQRTQEDAGEQLTDAGLGVGTVTEEFSEDIPAGQVLAQVPAADAELRRGTPVDLTVSKGPAPVEVPAVAGLSQDEAVKRIEAAGLEAAVEPERVNSRDIAKGSVAVQSPEGGLLERGGTVTLTISDGPRMVQVPSYVGKQADTARKELEDLGFEVQVNEILGGFFGTVRAQDPSGGTAPEGAVITLTVV
ncbi:Stk1 family PASTA domain-containing Ser/Thr kinase [Arthrobacter caoxuetaonis]|uniref:non-specific serine/threonine protein kinase n=1 Tax=Arthrobacter caoxuetaonis TaxID=2886935 RepID=A0A9X1SCZ3_9MICC|nr:Stk1 family PASTA domain-containing Ser/Thr kinase [Arthrobacter caoxuetaonis]MCC3299170.1 Stk1 family PASTA domain-containing Ser/Thr kinase [Arthrobacter caoxuetaonis]USQ58503.1 Stk1 family PASTA domain-containing Ser/Thr kinase [Arthrobacter caoxuetaonis]